MNISATFSIFRLLRDPSLCLPHSTVSTFQHLPVPISQAFAHHDDTKVDIRAVVLDKDNCFAKPGENEVYKPYEDKLHALKAAYPGARLLIVSNSAGTATSDPTGQDATTLEQSTGIPVLRHATKKPGAHPSILQYFLARQDATGVTHPSQIAVVGDRLFTDVMMANMMGSWAVWVRDGVVREEGLFVRTEKFLADILTRRGHVPPIPNHHSNPFNS